MRALVILAGLAAAAAVVAPAQGQTAPGVATVYSSLPLSGASRPQAQAIVRGARLALEEAGGGSGGVPVRYVSLNDASPRAGAWTPERTAANARRAAQDPAAIAYIGEFNSGASAISIPILDEADFPQISPTNTAVGLTRGGPGADRGEPEKYYPAARRAFFRLAPNDRVQGAALARVMRERGCRRIAVLHDGALPESGRLMLARFEERYGVPADPYAANGYEAMRLVLDAVAAVGPEPRAVTRWVRGLRGRSSVLGRYSFDRFGDTTIRRFGTYRIRRGGLVWAGAVRAP